MYRVAASLLSLRAYPWYSGFRQSATVCPARHCRLRGNGGPGRRHSPSCGNLSQQLNRPNTSLAACCPLSSSLPQGERTGRLLGLRFAARKTGCAGCFLFFRRPETTAANLSCLSNRLQPKNLPKPTPSPVGEGWGEGILQVAATFPNNLTAPIQALRLVALSPALSHGERGL